MRAANVAVSLLVLACGPAPAHGPATAPTSSAPIGAPSAPSGSADSSSASAPQTSATASAASLPEPPAGRSPCSAAAATKPVDAALACYNARVRPALLALSKSPDVTRYGFGAGSYLAHVVTIQPKAELQPGVDLPKLPDDLLARTTALGDLRAVIAERSYVAVLIVLRDKQMPTDGDMQLAFFVDAKTLETVLVYRIPGG